MPRSWKEDKLLWERLWKRLVAGWTDCADRLEADESSKALGAELRQSVLKQLANDAGLEELDSEPERTWVAQAQALQAWWTMRDRVPSDEVRVVSEPPAILGQIEELVSAIVTRNSSGPLGLVTWLRSPWDHALFARTAEILQDCAEHLGQPVAQTVELETSLEEEITSGSVLDETLPPGWTPLILARFAWKRGEKDWLDKIHKTDWDDAKRDAQDNTKTTWDCALVAIVYAVVKSLDRQGDAVITPAEIALVKQLILDLGAPCALLEGPDSEARSENGSEKRAAPRKPAAIQQLGLAVLAESGLVTLREARLKGEASPKPNTPPARDIDPDVKVMLTEALKAIPNKEIRSKLLAEVKDWRKQWKASTPGSSEESEARGIAVRMYEYMANIETRTMEQWFNNPDKSWQKMLDALVRLLECHHKLEIFKPKRWNNHSGYKGYALCTKGYRGSPVKDIGEVKTIFVPGLWDPVKNVPLVPALVEYEQ